MNRLLESMAEQLTAAGYRDLTLKPSQLLLSLRHDKRLILDENGLPTLRICNFELMQAGIAHEDGILSRLSRQDCLKKWSR